MLSFRHTKQTSKYVAGTTLKSKKCKKTPRDFAETLTNYLSYIQTFSLTGNFQNSRLKKEREKVNKTYLKQIFA